MIAKFTAMAAAILIASPALAQTGDATKGKIVFVRCMACHSVDAGVNRIGPSLAGIVGRPSASVPGFAYSPAMKNAKIRWDAKSLDAFLAKPTAKVPGSKMIFAGLPNPADRSNLIAYLAATSKK